MATNKVQIDEGSTTNLATNTISEDAVTKHLNRSVINTSAGTEIDTNSGNKSAATLRVILATDQPALANKLLVTPDLPSGAATAAKQPALGTAGTASTDVISIQGIASMTKLLTTPDLPTGASTAAKQPALGTAGTPSADVITVQGKASMTPLLVDPSGVTSPVSLASVPSHAVTNAGTFAVQETDGANTTLGAKADAKSTATDTTSITVMQVLKQISASVQAPPSQAVTNAGTFAVQDSAAETSLALIDDIILANDAAAGSAKAALVAGQYNASPAKVSTDGDAVNLNLTKDGRPLSLTESNDSFNINNNYSSAQTATSIQSTPGANKRLVVTKIIYSRDTAGNMKLVEDPAGTPATKFGPHYFPATGGMVAVDMYIPLTTNKALGITSVGGGNETITIYGITENV